jgi:hypothetical protein
MKKSEFKNVVLDKKNKCYIVTVGKKIKTYKTLAGAEKFALKNRVKITAPSIITANTYFWSPQGSASGRRSNERRHQDTGDAFINEVYQYTKGVDLEFTYSESCRNVYKNFSVHINDKKSNIKGLAGLLAKHGVSLEY